MRAGKYTLTELAYVEHAFNNGQRSSRGSSHFRFPVEKRGSIPCCSSLLLACVQTSPPIRKKLETGLLLPFFPEGSRGKGGGGGRCVHRLPFFFQVYPCALFSVVVLLFFVFLKKMNREHQRRAAGQPFYSVGLLASDQRFSANFQGQGRRPMAESLWAKIKLESCFYDSQT